MSGFVALDPPPPRLGARAPGDTDPVLLDWTAQLAACQVATGAVPASGGVNYAIGDLLYGPDGCIFAVATLSGSAVATVSVAASGLCLSATLPANPVPTTTNGAGGGATLALTWGAADTIASITGTTVTRRDGVPIGGSDLSITAASITGAGLQVMLTPAGGEAGVDYVISCTVVRASGPTLTRAVYQLVLSPLG